MKNGLSRSEQRTGSRTQKQPLDRKSPIQVTGFTNTEEEAVGLTTVVPFLVEDELKAKGDIFSKAADWQPYVLTDGLLITGQNPASSGPGAKALVEVMNRMAN
jgi:putative intracellular protease/amidase